MAVVVSCLAGDWPAFARLARSAARDADSVELRLDRLAELDEAALRELIASLGKPAIAACPGPDAWGEFRGAPQELLARLRSAARAGASFVDVDWRLADALGEPPRGARRVVSRHEPAARALDAARWLDELAPVARGGDVRKLVHEAASAEDALELLAAAARARGEIVAFSAGEVGSFSRLLAPLLGSPWTYAAPRRGEGPPTAPGQWPVDELAAELGRLGSRPVELYGVVGRPIRHSLSPAVHGELLRAAGRRAAYVAFEARDFPRFARAARDLGVRGLSITAPFKLAALEHAHEVDADARIVGAANTWVAIPAGWRASNTDLAGVRETFDRAAELLGRSLDGLAMLVLGAGGAARAVVAAARERGLRVTLAARDPARAEPLARGAGVELVAWERAETLRPDVLLNATPVGLRDGESPVPADRIRAPLVIDALYRSGESELLRTARARGALTLDGETWFLAQAAEQARAFAGIDPDRAALRALFRAARRSIRPPE